MTYCEDLKIAHMVGGDHARGLQRKSRSITRVRKNEGSISREEKDIQPCHPRKGAEPWPLEKRGKMKNDNPGSGEVIWGGWARLREQQEEELIHSLRILKG